MRYLSTACPILLLTMSAGGRMCFCMEPTNLKVAGIQRGSRRSRPRACSRYSSHNILIRSDLL